MPLSFDAGKKIQMQCDELHKAYEKRYEQVERASEELERVTCNLEGAQKELEEILDGCCGGPSQCIDEEAEREGSVLKAVMSKIDVSALDALVKVCKEGLERLKLALEEGDLDVEG
jgi:hypothetical protein